MKNKKLIPSTIVVLALLLLLIITFGDKKEDRPTAAFENYRIIAHAMGGINGNTYSNAYEAFVANYEQGTRMFETDLLLTEDHKLVARHEWTAYMSGLLGQSEVLPASKQGTVLNYNEFMDSPILGIYSPLDWDRILDLMEYYTDAYIVTDTKEFDSGLIMQQFEMLTEAARRRDPALLDRIIPQIYSRPMLEELQQIHPFPHIIYTLYQSQDNDQQVIDFAKEHKVDITMPESRTSSKFIKALKRTGARVYVHTLNDKQQIKKLYRMGVDGFYTDFISEDDLGSIYRP